jgi:hypothetical protein
VLDLTIQQAKQWVLFWFLMIIPGRHRDPGVLPLWSAGAVTTCPPAPWIIAAIGQVSW